MNRQNRLTRSRPDNKPLTQLFSAAKPCACRRATRLPSPTSSQLVNAWNACPKTSKSPPQPQSRRVHRPRQNPRQSPSQRPSPTLPLQRSLRASQRQPTPSPDFSRPRSLHLRTPPRHPAPAAAPGATCRRASTPFRPAHPASNHGDSRRAVNSDSLRSPLSRPSPLKKPLAPRP